MKARGDTLLGGRVRQHVSGQLLDRELVERHVSVDRANDPVAVRPDGPLPILFITVRVGVPRQVQPASGPAFAILRRREQPIDQPFVSIRRRIVDELVCFCRRRRNADQIEKHSPRERIPIHPRGRLEALRLEPTQHEVVDPIAPIARPTHITDFRRCRLVRCDERPMRPILGSVRDPTFEDVALFGAQLELRGWRRHVLLVAVRQVDAAKQLADLRMAGHNRPLATLRRSDRRVTHIQPQAALPLRIVRAVTLETKPSQDRPHLPLERRRLRRHQSVAQRQTNHHTHHSTAPTILNQREPAIHQTLPNGRLMRTQVRPSSPNAKSKHRHDPRSEQHAFGVLTVCFATTLSNLVGKFATPTEINGPIREIQDSRPRGSHDQPNHRLALPQNRRYYSAPLGLPADQRRQTDQANIGEVTERPIVLVSKTSVPARVPRVRIPPSPH